MYNILLYNGTSSKPNSSLSFTNEHTILYAQAQSIYTSTIIITIRRARCIIIIIIILYTRSVMLRLAATAAAASIPLAVPTPKCLGRNNIYAIRNLVAPGPDYIIHNNIILYCMLRGRRGLSVGLFFRVDFFYSHRLPSQCCLFGGRIFVAGCV